MMNNLEKLSQNSENEKLEVLEINQNNDLKMMAMAKILSYLMSINEKLIQFNSSNTYDSETSNFLMNLFFSTISLDFYSILKNKGKDCSNVFNMENLKKLANLKILIENDFVPIHQEV